jgi:hypothetical protein
MRLTSGPVSLFDAAMAVEAVLAAIVAPGDLSSVLQFSLNVGFEISLIGTPA